MRKIFLAELKSFDVVDKLESFLKCGNEEESSSLDWALNPRGSVVDISSQYVIEGCL